MLPILVNLIVAYAVLVCLQFVKDQKLRLYKYLEELVQ
jgi:hypothetical protein